MLPEMLLQEDRSSLPAISSVANLRKTVAFIFVDNEVHRFAEFVKCIPCLHQLHRCLRFVHEEDWRGLTEPVGIICGVAHVLTMPIAFDRPATVAEAFDLTVLKRFSQMPILGMMERLLNEAEARGRHQKLSQFRERVHSGDSDTDPCEDPT